MYVEHMQNLATMDEEFQTLVEYVEHQLLVKASMALDATWKEKKPKKLNSM
jgi:hypothetical protein